MEQNKPRFVQLGIANPCQNYLCSFIFLETVQEVPLEIRALRIDYSCLRLWNYISIQSTCVRISRYRSHAAWAKKPRAKVWLKKVEKTDWLRRITLTKHLHDIDAVVQETFCTRTEFCLRRHQHSTKGHSPRAAPNFSWWPGRSLRLWNYISIPLKYVRKSRYRWYTDYLC